MLASINANQDLGNTKPEVFRSHRAYSILAVTVRHDLIAWRRIAAGAEETPAGEAAGPKQPDRINEASYAGSIVHARCRKTST
jgi:hypothetical protein